MTRWTDRSTRLHCTLWYTFVLSCFLNKFFVRDAQVLSWALPVILILIVLDRLPRSFGHECTSTIKSTRLESMGLRRRASLHFGCGQRLLCGSSCLCVSKRDNKTPDAHSGRNMSIQSANVRHSGVFCRLYDSSPRQTGSFLKHRDTEGPRPRNGELDSDRWYGAVTRWKQMR